MFEAAALEIRFEFPVDIGQLWQPIRNCNLSWVTPVRATWLIAVPLAVRYDNAWLDMHVRRAAEGKRRTLAWPEQA